MPVCEVYSQPRAAEPRRDDLGKRVRRASGAAAMCQERSPRCGDLDVRVRSSGSVLHVDAVRRHASPYTPRPELAQRIHRHVRGPNRRCRGRGALLSPVAGSAQFSARAPGRRDPGCGDQRCGRRALGARAAAWLRPPAGVRAVVAAARRRPSSLRRRGPPVAAGGRADLQSGREVVLGRREVDRQRVSGAVVAYFFCGLGRLRPWQIMLGAVFLWVALGAFAWWSFHR